MDAHRPLRWADVEVVSCSLAGTQLAAAELRNVRFYGISDGYESLRGATISLPQLMDLAPGLARVLGVHVKEG